MNTNVIFPDLFRPTPCPRCGAEAVGGRPCAACGEAEERQRLEEQARAARRARLGAFLATIPRSFHWACDEAFDAPETLEPRLAQRVRELSPHRREPISFTRR
jgi:hypothetical protein